MKLKTFREAYTTKPFRPFNLRLSDGRALQVLHPEFLWQSPTEPRTLIVSKPEGGFNIIDLENVLDLDFEPLPHNESAH